MTISGPLLRAALVLGIGLGGFFDGIVFHQLLQWHHMLSSRIAADTVPGLELNTLVDGAFHAVTWLLTLAGVWLLLRAREGSTRDGHGRLVLGGLLSGWGAFNLGEGVVDHYLLQVHHVRPGPDEAIYDLAFLAWGVLFLAVGSWLARSAPREATRPAAIRRLRETRTRRS